MARGWTRNVGVLLPISYEVTTMLSPEAVIQKMAIRSFLLSEISDALLAQAPLAFLRKDHKLTFDVSYQCEALNARERIQLFEEFAKAGWHLEMGYSSPKMLFTCTSTEPVL